jgi:HK97 family phage major capsid protein
MPFNDQISRDDVGSLIPIEYSTELWEDITTQQSVVMMMARRLRDMNRLETTLAVPSALTTANFVEGDTGLIQTTEINWKDVTIRAEKLAAIVPIPKSVLDDSIVDIWSAARKDLAVAAGLAIDRAVLYGENKPTAWPDAIVVGANSAGHQVSLGGFLDSYDAILGENGVYSFVEGDGYAVTGNISPLSFRSVLRGTRTADGVPVFNAVPGELMTYELDGAMTLFPVNGAGNDTYKMISGMWNQLVYSVRSDMEFTLSTDSVIQDSAGNIIYNLFQQDMAALKVTMRLGFQLPNAVNRVNENEATRYPFATLIE